MGKNLEINSELEKYIEDLSYNLHPIQQEIIKYNYRLGDIKRMQISVSQCHFLHLITRVSKIKSVLEIGTFTGLSTLSIALALPDAGSLIALDKNESTNKVAINFFKKANQEKKIKTIIKPAIDSLNELKKNNKIFDMVFIDIGGVYCENCEVAVPMDDGENARFIGVNDWAVDSEEASRLWDETELMLS